MATETATDWTSAPRRRFTLLDGMILVAATAIGFAGVQGLERLLDDGSLVNWLRESWAERSFVEMALCLCFISMPILAAWTVALVPLRLLQPRPRFRRLARQPGLMAALAVTMAFGIVGPLIAFARMDRTYGINELRMIWTVEILPVFFGLAVLVAWVTLIVGRRWRPEPSWLDRTGRVLGVLWIVLASASMGLLWFGVVR